MPVLITHLTMIITHPRIEGATDPKVGLPYATLMEETIAQYVERVDENKLVEVTIKMAISQKTLKAQSFALNALKHPPSAKPPPSATPYLPEFRSQQAYRSTLRFDPAEALLPEVDLVSEFKGIENVIVNKAAKVYDNLPDPMQKCLTAMLFAIFGSALEKSHKLLYIMNNNVSRRSTRALLRTFCD